MPSRRDQVLDGWLQWCRRFTLGYLKRIGGATLDIRARIESRPGVLILVNHQSLLDIPVAMAVVKGRHPIIIARQRYARGIPLISYMIRLYDHITVLPGSRDRQQLKRIRRRATDLDRPLVVYPEGTRTRDGSLRPFRTSGLRSILTCRRWQVYLVVLDGLWKAGRFSEFVANISGIDGEVDMVGPYEFDPEKDDAKLFIPEMERRMAEKLAEMRRTKGRTTDHSDVVERS